MFLRVRVLSTDGDKVNVNLPVKLIEILVGNETLMNKIGGGGEKGAKWVQSVDFNQILALISLGVTGKLVEVQSADGDRVEVWVE